MSDPVPLLSRHLGINPPGPERAILQLLIELAAQVVGAEEGSLLVVDFSQDPPRDLVFAMTAGSHESERVLLGQRVPIGEGLTGLAAITHEVQVGAPEYDGLIQLDREDSPASGVQGVIAAPMLIQDRLIGVITAVTFEPEMRFTREHAEIYARAASVAGVVLDLRRRLDDARAPGTALEAQHTDPVEREIFASVTRLVRSLEGRHEELKRLLQTLEALCGRDL
jgi:transcriptional regulator with GAF, ATPase, and Fis domain